MADCDAVKGLGARTADEVEVVWLKAMVHLVVQTASCVLAVLLPTNPCPQAPLLTTQPFGVRCEN